MAPVREMHGIAAKIPPREGLMAAIVHGRRRVAEEMRAELVYGARRRKSLRGGVDARARRESARRGARARRGLPDQQTPTP